MNEELKKLLATIGRALITLAGDEAAAVQEMPVPTEDMEGRQRKKPVWRKFRDMTCVRCGTVFQAKTSLAKYCDGCKAAIQKAKLNKFIKNYVREAEAHAPMPEVAPQPQPKTADMVRCERMHATIPATMCGTRGECQGKPLCPNLPK